MAFLPEPDLVLDWVNSRWHRRLISDKVNSLIQALRSEWRRPNWIINGDFEVWQHGTSWTSAAAGTRTADRFIWRSSAVDELVIDIAQSTDVPTYAESGHLSQYSLLFTIQTPETAIDTNDRAFLTYRAEGYDLAQLAEKTLTFSFWVKSSVTGTFSCTFGTGTGGSQTSYAFDYTINSANTWEKKVKTLFIDTSVGSPHYDHQRGIDIRWCFGSTLPIGGTPEVWEATNSDCTANDEAFMLNSGATIRFAQVKLEIGRNATPFQRRGDTYGDEVALCERYYQKSFNLTTQAVQNAGVGTGEHSTSALGASQDQFNYVHFRTRMLTTPTVTIYNPAAANAQARDKTAAADCSGTTVSNNTQDGFTITTVSNAASALGNEVAFHWDADAEL